jgi:hypothetical protein
VPSELASPDRTAIFQWGLNGYRYIYLGAPSAGDPVNLATTHYPISACLSFKETFTEADLAKLGEEKAKKYPALHVSALSSIGILCWGPPIDDPDGNDLDLDGSETDLYLGSMALAAELRVLPEVASFEWSKVNFGLPNEFAPGQPLTGPGKVYPECERTYSKQLQDEGLDFRSSASFPPPFGPGWSVNKDACK